MIQFSPKKIPADFNQSIQITICNFQTWTNQFKQATSPAVKFNRSCEASELMRPINVNKQFKQFKQSMLTGSNTNSSRHQFKQAVSQWCCKFQTLVHQIKRFINNWRDRSIRVHEFKHQFKQALIQTPVHQWSCKFQTPVQTPIQANNYLISEARSLT